MGDVIECPSGEDTRFKFELKDNGKFEVTGLLVSLDDGTVVVTGPEGDITASLSDDAEIEGDPQPGDAVEVEGWTADNGDFVADEIDAKCDSDDDHDAGDDDDDRDDDHDDHDGDDDDHDGDDD